MSKKYRQLGTGHSYVKTVVVGSFILMLLNGCMMVGPEYEKPDAAVEGKWQQAGDPLISGSVTEDKKWWSSAFQDLELDALINEALQQNLSLRSAGLLVLQSQQQLAIAIGDQFPQQQQLNGTAIRQRSDGNTFSSYNLGFNLSWEADFWGRFTRQVESASATLDASVASYDSVMVSLVSQVANNYILIRTFQERIKVANSNIGLQEESLRITRAKFDEGEVSELDVFQAESLVNNTRATVSTLEVSLQQLKNSLAVLLGKTPEKLQYLLAQEKERYNILWLSCEDISPTLGCYGTKGVKTPNIDKLATEGIRYTNAYSTVGVCAPSRSTPVRSIRHLLPSGPAPLAGLLFGDEPSRGWPHDKGHSPCALRK